MKIFRYQLRNLEEPHQLQPHNPIWLLHVVKAVVTSVYLSLFVTHRTIQCISADMLLYLYVLYNT